MTLSVGHIVVEVLIFGLGTLLAFLGRAALKGIAADNDAKIVEAKNEIVRINGEITHAEEKIQELRNNDKAQWSKIDDLRESQSQFITVGQHMQSRKEIFDAIKDAVRPVVEGQNRLAEKIDRVIENMIERK